MRRRMIGVMGAGDNATPQAVAWASRLGALIAGQGWVLLSGGRNTGVMEAVSSGAHKAGGTVVGIMPRADAAEASDFLDIAIVTGMGSARNNINVLSSDVVIACGNAEAGTLSEIALAFKAGKPVVLITEDDEARRFLERTGRGLLHPAHSPEEVIVIARDLLET
ncbi:MAG: TIGR00725 family protein [Actinomycetia bacterium]|nr:TIGR00725 family protein [Actinomycetes bacterium]